MIDTVYNQQEILKSIKDRITSTAIVSEKIYGDGASGQKIANILADTTLPFHKTIMY